MSAVRRIAGALMILSAAAVAFFAMFDPFFDDNIFVWTYLNPIMFVALALGTLVAFHIKRDAAASVDASAMRRLEAGALFYGFLFVDILFMSNWLDAMLDDSQRDVRFLVWYFINAILPVMVGYCGVYLLRRGGD